MAYMIYAEIISYFGMIWLMANMQKRGKLTEQYFALMQIAYLTVFILTGFLLTPLTSKVTLVWAVITILLWVLGYPFARWVYRQLFPR